MSIRHLIQELRILGVRKSSFDRSKSMRKAAMTFGKKKVRTKGTLTPLQRKQRQRAAKISARRRRGKPASKRKLVFR